MDNKTPERTSPKPGIAEAIHPEIGNGVSWEVNRHHSLLRSPDPTKELETLLEIEQVIEMPADDLVKQDELLTIAADLQGSEEDTVEVIAEIKTGGHAESDETPFEEEKPAPPVFKREKGKSDRKKKSKNKDTETEGDAESLETLTGDPDQTKAPKAGKLIRKAAKSVRRKEDEEKKAAMPIIALTESTLSPYTQWLKALRGSDYVHPYDDDFALAQGTGPGREGISETYADLLAAQGYKEQAVEMYMKLMEKYPEKSGFFAAKIEALQ